MPNELLPQFTRYAMVGAFNTAIDVAVYAALTRWVPWFGVHYLAAAVVAFLVVIAVGFVLNARLTFQHPLNDWSERIPRFAVVVAVGTAIDAASLSFLVDHGLHDVAAKLVAVCLAGLWNYPMHRWWTFAPAPTPVPAAPEGK